MTTPIADPSWEAARNGLPGDTAAVNHASQADQFLASHAITPVYTGTALVTPAGNTGFGDGSIDWLNLGQVDVDQPFTLPGGHTAIGRVTLPLSPVGNSADVTVSLCADSSGNPGTVITSVVIPAAHLLQLTAPDGLASGGPLATARSNTLRLGEMTYQTWAVPQNASSAVNPAQTASGNNFILATSENGTPTYFSTLGWPGGADPGPVIPQPSLTTGTAGGMMMATDETLVYAGGYTGATLTTYTANVWAAAWNPASGQIQGWTAQTALPAATAQGAGAADPATGTVYVIGGYNSSGTPVTNVWWATIANGQVGTWHAGPALPAATAVMFAAVVNGWLIAGGGLNVSAVQQTAVWYAPLAADGTPGGWLPGPPMPVAGNYNCGAGYAVTSDGLIVLAVSGVPLYYVQTLTVTADGPAARWQQQQISLSAILDAPSLVSCGAFASGPGAWEFIVADTSGNYSAAPVSSVPAVSVPLPATGLTGGATYHILLHQDTGTAADYVQAALDPGALAAAAQTRPNAGGSWTGLSNTYSLFAAVFDQAPGGQPLHLWQDGGARVVTFIWGSASGVLLGAVETTSFPSGAPEAVLCEAAQVGYGASGLPSGVTLLA